MAGGGTLGRGVAARTWRSTKLRAMEEARLRNTPQPMAATVAFDDGVDVVP